jgi:hypothetical protein
MKQFRVLVTAAALFGFSLGVSPSWAIPFTGPTSPYFLDNYHTQQIFVVQGTSVINSFPWAYGPPCTNYFGFCEGNLAVTNVVSTNWFGTVYGGSATAGQYTLSGTPTGTSWSGTPPLAGGRNQILDGTSNGTHNYAVESFNSNGTQNVLATDLNWQHPVALFSVPPSTVGITYDPNNNSLWLSNVFGVISDYTLTGTLLSSFSPGFFGTALAFDPADGTLWFNNGEVNQLFQYSTSGVFLQSGIPTGLPSFFYVAGEFAETEAVPEPTTFALSAAVSLASTEVPPRVLTLRPKKPWSHPANVWPGLLVCGFTLEGSQRLDGSL